MSGVFGSSLNGQPSDDEFRPFIRRLPEFKVSCHLSRIAFPDTAHSPTLVSLGQFWHSATQAIVISLFCTFFSAFDVPVFWPILVMYFCILFAITMRRQIK